MNGFRTRRAFYAGAAALALVLVGVLTYRAWNGPSRPERAASDEVAANDPVADSPRTRRRPASQLIVEDKPPLTANRREEAAHFVGEARRRAIAGDFDGAEAALKSAEAIAPGEAATGEAAAEIAELKSPRGRLATLLAQARSAIDHEDTGAARRLIAEAERLDPAAPALADLRRDVQAAEARAAQQQSRLAALIAAMREALRRRDFAAAYRALNEAERLDIQSPDVQQARAELNQVQDEKFR